jgi:hypothetical protein
MHLPPALTPTRTSLLALTHAASGPHAVASIGDAVAHADGWSRSSVQHARLT